MLRSLQDIEREQRLHRKSWFHTAGLLFAIREHKLYKPEHAYFSTYIKARNTVWGMTWSQVSGYLAAYAISITLPSDLPEPILESHLRPLLQYSKRTNATDIYKAVWRKVHDLAEQLDTEVSQRLVIKACEDVTAQTLRLDVSHSSPWLSQSSDRWHSSTLYLSWVLQVLEVIHCDPCTDDVAQLSIGAPIYYTKENDGLCPSNPWGSKENPSNVHANVPGGVSSEYSIYPDSKARCYSLQGRFILRALHEIQLGTVRQVVIHVKAAIGYTWFQTLAFNHPLCFLHKRIEFTNPDRENTGISPHGSAVIYLGPYVSRFVEVFSAHGQIVLPTSISAINSKYALTRDGVLRWGTKRKRRCRHRQVDALV